MADATAAPVIGARLRQWFEALKGDWGLQRVASDGSTFAGKASFVPIGENQFLLTEEGKFFPAGNEKGMPAGRQWVWRLLPTGLLEIRYPEPDNRLYHCFSPHRHDEAWQGEATHPCGADLYHGRYRLGADAMEIVHDVEGPAKHYRLTSRFMRAGPQ